MGAAVWVARKSRRWSMAQWQRAVCSVMVALVLVNLLHLWDEIREARGETTMRQAIWRWLGLRYQTTRPPIEWPGDLRKDSEYVGSAPLAGPSRQATESPQSLARREVSNAPAHVVGQRVWRSPNASAALEFLAHWPYCETIRLSGAVGWEGLWGGSEAKPRRPPSPPRPKKGGWRRCRRSSELPSAGTRRNVERNGRQERLAHVSHAASRQRSASLAVKQRVFFGSSRNRVGGG
jgi:hypothetical protein